MECNLILAGVGGQGILTIAQALSLVAIRRGWNVKQSEVHGMSQRGGDVQSHLRLADQPLYSDLVPLGQADMVLAVEPLEALRYIQYLRPHGALVSSSGPVVNIPNYPPIEEVLSQVTRHPDHLLLNADRIAREAGSARASNIVMLGAASVCLPFEINEYQAVISEIFITKGAKLIETNLRAFQLGRAAGLAYREALRLGSTPAAVRTWLDTLSAEQMLNGVTPDPTLLDLVGAAGDLTTSQQQAVTQILDQARNNQRQQLYEHEIYALIELVGAISPPAHGFVRTGEIVKSEQLARFRGDQVVLKLVSSDVVHKTEAGGVRFVAREVDAVNRELRRMISVQQQQGHHVEGVLLVEFIPQARVGFGGELFVGIRNTREFGPVIAAGLGGVDTEYLATKMLPGIAVAKALAVDTSAEQFFELFQKTAAYEILAGQVRGHQRVISDGELRRCFRAFIAIARAFCNPTDAATPALAEMEVNPFAFAQQKLVPLDGRGRLGLAGTQHPARPAARIEALLEPRSIAVLGVSSKRMNFGRIILNNVKEAGFPLEHLYAIKEEAGPIDGVRCCSTIAAVPEKIDLLVAATAAAEIPQLIDEAVKDNKVASVILIPGGLGEKEGTEALSRELHERIAAARQLPGGGPVFLGGNSMGLRSVPGRYDTFFIAPTKLDPRRQAAPKPLALISQSGAFIITRMSNVENLDPRLAISVGNQSDLTVADLVQVVGQRRDIDCLGVYVEGFNDLDGLSFIRAVRETVASGKVVVFYKAGRTSAGRTAAQGHTASIAGDYDVCQAAAAQAGAIVVDTFKEFEQLLELGSTLHQRSVHGQRLGVISNAGYETVGMADTIKGARYQIEMPSLNQLTTEKLTAVLKQQKLDGLVNARNPLDLTPMASDEAYEQCARVLLEANEIDALIISTVPLTTQLHTTPDEIVAAGSLPQRLVKLFAEAQKPLIGVVDAGSLYDPLARKLREGGVPVFRSADQAVRSLARYLTHRSMHNGQPINCSCPPAMHHCSTAISL
ncbi:MAG: hypothetical protein HJJLKODD_02383 [Phycisphaerae bacterium]|nr:hypothetical protein [Phycisphaerae bacterium]